MEDSAIKAALEGNWSAAIKFNLQIIKEKKDDIDALNRLSFAQAQLGKIAEAMKTCRRALRINAYDPIARKNIAKFKVLPQTKRIRRNDGDTNLSPALFLAESERVRSVNLVNLAPYKVLQQAYPCQEVIPTPKGFELQIKTKQGLYLGAFPDDVSRSLMNLLKKKIACHFFIQDIGENSLTIFIKSNAQYYQ